MIHMNLEYQIHQIKLHRYQTGMSVGFVWVLSILVIMFIRQHSDHDTCGGIEFECYLMMVQFLLWNFMLQQCVPRRCLLTIFSELYLFLCSVFVLLKQFCCPCFFHGDVRVYCQESSEESTDVESTFALKCHISHEVNHLHEGLKHVSLKSPV